MEARNISTGISRPTIYDYVDVLNRLMILEDQPAWNTHIRSSHTLRNSPNRHFTDVSLAVAAIGANQETLLNNLNFTGFLFESMVIGVLLRLNWVPAKLMKLLLICCGLLVWLTLTNALRLNH